MSHRFPSARWLAAGGAALSLFAPGVAHGAQGEIGCANVDVVVTRGSAEPSGSSIALDAGTNINSETGVWSMIRKELQTPTDGSTPISQIVTPNASGQVVRTDVDYPADLPFPSSGQGDVADSTVFRRSVRLGTQRVIEYLNQQVARCPSKRYVLLGYSQGAVVVGNVLTDNVAERLWIDSAPLPALNAAAKSNVAAVGLFADVGFNQNLGWAVHSTTLFGASAAPYLQNTTDDLNRGVNDGNSSHITTAPSVRSLTAWDAATKLKVRDYCIQNDFICQGTGSLTEHLYYGDAGQPAPRRNLAIHAIQKLRNQYDKTLATTCSITYASDPAQLGKTYAATLRIRGTINDRGVAGGTTAITNPSQTFSVNAANADKLRAILGGATTVDSALVQLPIAGATTNGTSTSTSSKTWSTNLSTVPIPAATPWSISTSSSTTQTWPLLAGDRVDFSTPSIGILASGTNGSWARSDCALPTANQARTLGRVIVS